MATDIPPRLFFLKTLGFKPRTILDIGAHNGEWLTEVHEEWPSSKYFAIEASPDLEEDLKKINWLKGYEIALLGERVKRKVPYFLGPGKYTTGNSIYKEQSRYFEGAKVRHFSMTTLDAVVIKNRLAKIDFIKIDTQGSELSIIKGGEKTVSEAEFILLELQNLECNLGAPFAPKVISEMDKRGFCIFDILKAYPLNTGETAQLDVLFAKKGSRFVRKGILQ